jgi:hypothetical protein
MRCWLPTVIGLVLTGCSASGPRTAATESTSSIATRSELATSTTSTIGSRSATSTTNETGPASEVFGSGPLFLRPIDSRTLVDSPTAPRFGVGTSLWWAKSKNGRWLAAAGFSTTEGDNPTFRLVDTTTWTSSDLLSVPELDGVASLAVSDSGMVIWLGSESRGWPVYQLSRGSSQPVLVAEMDPSLRPIVQPADIGALSEEYLAVPAYEFDGDHYGGETAIQIVDLTTGEVSTVPLEGVWSGHVLEQNDDPEEIGRSLEPGFGFDRDRDLLYLASASEDEILVVDLVTSAVVERKDFQEPSSLLSRALEWWVPKADAKVLDGSRRNVALSPDGSRLYVTTARAESNETDGEFRWQDVPLGVEVIDTENFNVIARNELPVSRITISPDGSVLLASGVHERSGDDWSVRGSGAYLLDANDLSVVAHLDDGVDYQPDGFSPDSAHAYVWTFRDSMNIITYVAIDVPSGTSVASRDVAWPGYISSGVVADTSP